MTQENEMITTAATVSAAPTDVTYSQLVNLINTSALTPFAQYRITDYQTKYVQPVSNLMRTGTVEKLVVSAVAANKLAEQCFSAEYPNDIIYYDYSRNLCEDGSTPRTGFILERVDTKYNIRAPHDWRKIKWARYGIDTYGIETFTSGMNVTRGKFYLYNNKNLLFCVRSGVTTSYGDTKRFINISSDINLLYLHDDIEIPVGSQNSVMGNSMYYPLLLRKKTSDYHEAYTFDFNGTDASLSGFLYDIDIRNGKFRNLGTLTNVVLNCKTTSNQTAMGTNNSSYDLTILESTNATIARSRKSQFNDLKNVLFTNFATAATISDYADSALISITNCVCRNISESIVNIDGPLAYVENSVFKGHGKQTTFVRRSIVGKAEGNVEQYYEALVSICSATAEIVASCDILQILDVYLNEFDGHIEQFILTGDSILLRVTGNASINSAAIANNFIESSTSRDWYKNIMKSEDGTYMWYIKNGSMLINKLTS